MQQINSLDDLPKAPRSSRWSQAKRLEFIDFRLRWDFRINRQDLIDFFGISIAQASLDLSRYIELAPNNVLYDKSQKVYIAQDSFKPLFEGEGGVDKYLIDLLAISHGVISPSVSPIGWMPPLAVVVSPQRSLDESILSKVLQAIRWGKTIEVEYLSMNKPEPSVRQLNPHAIAHDGFRWHVRAFCKTRESFRDFVIARILSCELMNSIQPTPTIDHEWNNSVVLKIGPNKNLSATQQRIIELDYGMVNGVLEVECRQSLLFYTLRRLGLDSKSNEENPQSQQIVLINRNELNQFL